MTVIIFDRDGSAHKAAGAAPQQPLKLVPVMAPANFLVPVSEYDNILRTQPCGSYNLPVQSDRR